MNVFVVLCGVQLQLHIHFKLYQTADEVRPVLNKFIQHKK